MSKGQKRDECLEFYKLHPLVIKNAFIYHCYQGEVNSTVALQEDEKNCALGCFYEFCIQATAKLFYKLPQHQHTDKSTGETLKISGMRTADIAMTFTCSFH